MARSRPDTPTPAKRKPSTRRRSERALRGTVTAASHEDWRAADSILRDEAVRAEMAALELIAQPWKRAA